MVGLIVGVVAGVAAVLGAGAAFFVWRLRTRQRNKVGGTLDGKDGVGGESGDWEGEVSVLVEVNPPPPLLPRLLIIRAPPTVLPLLLITLSALSREKRGKRGLRSAEFLEGGISTPCLEPFHRRITFTETIIRVQCQKSRGTGSKHGAEIPSRNPGGCLIHPATYGVTSGPP